MVRDLLLAVLIVMLLSACQAKNARSSPPSMMIEPVSSEPNCRPMMRMTARWIACALAAAYELTDAPSITAQEFARADAAQELKRNIRSHG